SATPAVLDAASQVFLEHLPIGQLGQVIVVCLMPDRRFAPTLLGHGGEQADAAIDAAIFVVGRIDRQAFDVFFSRFAPVVDIAVPAAGLMQLGPHCLVEGLVVAT